MEFDCDEDGKDGNESKDAVDPSIIIDPRVSVGFKLARLTALR
jgi:hypothetical protein